MIRHAIAAVVLLLGCSYWNDANAANCANYTYTFVNGQVADANQVNSNFQNILGCGNNSLLGKNNNLSDVASPATSRFNLGLGAAAVEGLSSAKGGAVTDDGAGNLVAAIPVLHSVVLTGTGVFVIPATATASTVFKFTAVGGGGGGGSSAALGGGGASGAYGVALFSGFTANTSVTISIGGGGSGATGNAVGSTGGTTTVTYNAVAVVTAAGGTGGQQIGGGTPGTFSATAGASGLTLVSSELYGAQPGDGTHQSVPGNGGGNPIGTGGLGPQVSSSNGANGLNGGGGSGQSSVTGGNTGGSGGSGVVIVEWVL